MTIAITSLVTWENLIVEFKLNGINLRLNRSQNMAIHYQLYDATESFGKQTIFLVELCAALSRSAA